MMEFEKERREVALFMRRLYSQKLTTASGGNVSVRDGDHVFITASQTDKAKLKAGNVGIITLDGNNLTQELKISMESKMHLAVYQKRKDILAIVHAHPVFATAYAISGKEIKTNLAGEARALLGVPALTQYALMGTRKLAGMVASASLTSNVILLENHGVITLGSTLFQAYERMEVLEATAKLTFITSVLGDAKQLTQKELKAVDELFE
ncbi:MAG: class II aldolase/adducin family protein [Bacteroidetes bacterium]|nr:class II aldolase/adducin family protein [Bacteroidota bacterium]